MNIQNYRQVIPSIQELIRFCRKQGIPIFYTQAIREPSGIVLHSVIITSVSRLYLIGIILRKVFRSLSR